MMVGQPLGGACSPFLGGAMSSSGALAIPLCSLISMSSNRASIASKRVTNGASAAAIAPANHGGATWASLGFNFACMDRFKDK